MKITGLTLNEFERCAAYVSSNRYGGNIAVHRDAHDKYGNGKPGCTARLTVHDSHGPGSRTSRTGRHGPYACWHAYRDVLREVFTRYPDAVITAGNSWRVTYRGASGFEELHPATGYWNIGSQARPVTMPELCDCPANDDRIDRIAMTLATAAPLAVATQEGVDRIRGIARRVADRMDDYGMSYQTAGVPGYIPPSPAIEQARKQYAASAELLGEGDKPADPWVFGPEDGPTQYS